MQFPGYARTVARRSALTVAGGALLWATAVMLFGNFEFTLLGARITNYDSVRPLVWAGLAFSAFAALNGLPRTVASYTSALARVDGPWVAVVLAAVVFLTGLIHATTTASAADAYGYVSQADLWLTGRLLVEQPWVAHIPWAHAAATFAPLGYRAINAGSTLVPTYSPGLPLLMAAAKAIGGQAAMYWIVPLSGALLVFATWDLGRQLLSSRHGVVAALLMATSPTLLFMLMPPMSDVPAAAAWTLAWCCAVRGTRSSAYSALAGVAAGAAMLARPNLAPLTAALALTILAAGHERSGPRLRHLPAFAAGALPAVLTIALINRRLNGSPLTSGYGDLGQLFASGNVWPNLVSYGRWLIQTETPVIVLGLAVALAPLAWFWPDAPARRFVQGTSVFALGLCALYLPYLPFHEWTFLRFLLPMFPLLMLGVAAVLGLVARRMGPGGRLAVVWLVLALGMHRVDVARQRGAFSEFSSDRDFVAAAQQVHTLSDDQSVVFSLIHSGSLRYYGGRVTARYDQVPGDALDDDVAWLSAHGVRAYALLAPWEVAEFLGRFAGQRAIEHFESRLVFEYIGENTHRFYDLTQASGPAVRIPRADSGALRSSAPVPVATLHIR